MSKDNKGLLPRTWEQTQISVFTKWVNANLKKRNNHINDLFEFSDGVKLIDLLEIVSKKEIKSKFHHKPTMRIQMIENCNLAVNFIQSEMGIKLVGVGGLDIVDKNLKLTLGMLWSVISKCHLDSIMEGHRDKGQSSRDALLKWCKESTQGYPNVSINDFTTSWSSGLAFCALINKYVPQVLDYNSLDPNNQFDNVNTALEACKNLGISVFLEPSDLVGVEEPDEKSIITQVAELFRFLTDESLMNAARFRLFRTQSINEMIEKMIKESTGEIQSTLITMRDKLHPFLANNQKYCSLCEQLFTALCVFYEMLKKCPSPTELKEAQENSERYKQEMMELRAQLNKINSLLSVKNDEISQLKEENERQLKEQQNKLEAKKQKLKKLKQEKEEQKLKLEKLEKELKDKVNESEQMKNELKETKNKMQQQIDDLKSNYSKCENDLKIKDATIDGLKQQISFNKSDATAKDMELEKLQSQIGENLSEILQLKQNKQQNEEQINQMREEMKTLEQTQEKQKEEIQKLNEQINEQLEQLKQQQQLLLNKKNKHKNYKALKEKEIDELKKMMEELKSQSLKQSEEKYKANKKKLKSAKNIIEGLKAEYGHGTLKNISNALAHYQMAADLGDPEGYFSLARLYERGMGTTQNYHIAAQNYELAVENEHYASMNNLAAMYLTGRGVSQNAVKAANLFKTAADNGCAAAQSNFAILLEQGKGIAKDSIEANKYLQMAAEQGHPKAMNNLAYKMENGIDIRKDLQESLKLYTKAAEHGNAAAVVQFGRS
ncbi:putative alpha-actinin [Histomonas meleagridis]|nr:putative alpha-actinin [Histomonas meleagridis]